tara:strand:- start:35 stop:136 length:102 start_codon:yes stop_codon:yes gene_type:complete
MDRIDETNVPEDKELLDLLLEKINEIVDWINSQ